MVALEEENIESRPIWKPMHLQPFYEGYDFVSYYADDARALVAATSEDRLDRKVQIASASEDIFNRGVCLPSDTKMTDDDLTRVCNIIKGLWV